jgi:phosphate starvation-inducible PhoH-like protein
MTRKRRTKDEHIQEKKEIEEQFHAPKEIKFKPLTKGQEDYIIAISENTVTFCDGPPGTGKTMLAVGMACQYLEQGRVEKIFIARPAVQASKNGIGFTPGTIEEKIAPYMIPVMEYLQMFLGHKLKDYLERKIIVLEPLEFLKGRSFHKTFMILDESQNGAKEGVKMFVSRMGKDSKVIVAGDRNQKDIYDNGFSFIFDRLHERPIKNFATVVMTKDDIVRNPLLKDFLDLFEDIYG